MTNHPPSEDHEPHGDHEGHGCAFDPATLPQQYEQIASLAIGRFSHPQMDTHFVLHQADEDTSHQLFVGIVEALIHKVTEESDLNTDEKKMKAVFTLGFFFGRAFEEVNVMRLYRDGLTEFNDD